MGRLISISTRSISDADCTGGAKAHYPAGITFVGALKANEITLTPSAKEDFGAAGTSKRTKHLIIIKCTTKDNARKKFLGLDDCTDYNADPQTDSKCASFNSLEYGPCQVTA